MLTNSSDLTQAGAGAGSSSDLSITRNDVIKIMNHYYNLKGDIKHDYPELLRPFYDVWNLNAEAIKAFNDKAPEEKKAKVQETLDKIALFLESIGVDASKYKSGNIFYDKLTTNSGYYTDQHLTLFMREALSFINIVSQLESIKNMEDYLDRFPSPDEDQYICLAGIRDAQMYIYMDLKIQQMPYHDRVLVEAHRDVVENWRKKINSLIPEKYQTHILSAIEHLLGIDSKEPDTITAMNLIPSQIACQIIGTYQEKLQEAINTTTTNNIENIKKLLSRLNGNHADDVEDTISEEEKKEVRDFLWGINIAKIGDLDAADSLLTVNLKTGIRYWDITKALALFKNINIRDTITLPRPQSLFGRPNVEKVISLLLSSDDKDIEAGLEILLLSGSSSRPGNNPIQFLNFIQKLGLHLNEENLNGALEEGMRFLQKLPKSKKLDDVLGIMRSIMEDTENKPYIKIFNNNAASDDLKLFIEILLSTNTNFLLSTKTGSAIATEEEIKKYPHTYLEALTNEKFLESILHNPNFIFSLNKLLSTENYELEESKLRQLGVNLVFLATKYGRSDIINYVRRDFSSIDSPRRGPKTNSLEEGYGVVLMRDGLIKFEENEGRGATSGLEYLADTNPNALESLLNIIEEPISTKGETLFHRLASRGNVATIARVLNFIENKKTQALEKGSLKSLDFYEALPKRLFLRENIDGQTILHVAIQNAHRNPSQASSISLLISNAERLGILEEMIIPRSPGKQSLLSLAIDLRNISIITRLIANLPFEYKQHLLLLFAESEDKEFLTNPRIVEQLLCDLSDEEKNQLLYNVAKKGHVDLVKTLVLGGANPFVEFKISEDTKSESAFSLFLNEPGLKTAKFIINQSFSLALEKDIDQAFFAGADRNNSGIVKLLLSKGVNFGTESQKKVLSSGFKKLQSYKERLSKLDKSQTAACEELVERISRQKEYLNYILETPQIKGITNLSLSDKTFGNTSSIIAARKGRFDIACVRIELGLEENPEACGNDYSVLHLATRDCDVDAVRYLTDLKINGGAELDPNLKTKETRSRPSQSPIELLEILERRSEKDYTEIRAILTTAIERRLPKEAPPIRPNTASQVLLAARASSAATSAAGLGGGAGGPARRDIAALSPLSSTPKPLTAASGANQLGRSKGFPVELRE